MEQEDPPKVVTLLTNAQRELFEGRFARVSTQNFSAYLDKIGLSKAKRKIALNSSTFFNIITCIADGSEIQIATEIGYAVDIGGTTTTETRYSENIAACAPHAK
jgi:hypothetical protein